MPVRVRVQRPERRGLARRVTDAWNQAASRVLRDEAETLAADVFTRFEQQLTVGRPVTAEERDAAKAVGVDLDDLIKQYRAAMRDMVSELPEGGSSVALDLGLEGKIHPSELAKFFEYGSAIFLARPHWWAAWRAVLERLPTIKKTLRQAFHEEMAVGAGRA